MPNKKAVILLSGGLDSAVTLYSAKKQGYDCYCLIFDYCQRHDKEIFAAKKIARVSGSGFQIVKISLPWKGSSLLDRKINVPKCTGAPLRFGSTSLTTSRFGQAGHSFDYSQGRQGRGKIPNTYVPARNIIFLSFALSFAETINAEAVFIGAHAEDYSGYPDCRPDFYRAFIKAAKAGTKRGVEGNPVKIITPLINKNKSQIIGLGMQLGVPFEFTWSCYKGNKNPCGVCDSCYYRAKGFEEAGITDPLINRKEGAG